MRNIKRQLRAYYIHQGITSPKQLHKAVRRDVCRVRRNVDLWFATLPEDHRASCAIGGAFYWSDSKQGWDYWNARDVEV